MTPVSLRHHKPCKQIEKGESVVVATLWLSSGKSGLYWVAKIFGKDYWTWIILIIPQIQEG